MFSMGYSLLMALKIVILFTLIYIFIPSKIINFKSEEKFLDKVFISFIYSNIITIAIVHLLAFLKLYELFSLLFCYLAVYILYSWQKGRHPAAIADALGMKMVFNMLEMSEGRSGLRGESLDHLRNWLNQLWASIVMITRKYIFNPFAGLFVLVTFAAAAVIRFKHSIVHAYFGAADSYVHLAWMKYLGLNEIYRDGIYSYGYHAILSALSKLFFLDPYFVIRFVGPLAGFLLVLSVYYFASRNFKSIQAGLIAIFIYGIIIDDRLPSFILRQSNALSQEYATIFLLPGIHFFILYMRDASTRYLRLSAACLTLTLLIHPYVTVFLLLGYIIVFLCHPGNLLKKKYLTKSFMTMLLSCFAGVLPLMIGIIIGKSFHQSSISAAEHNLQLRGVSINSLTYLPEINPFLQALLLCSALMLAYGMLLKIRRNDHNCGGIYISLALISLTSYLLYKAPEFGLPTIMNPHRTGMFMSLFAVLTYAGTMDAVNLLAKRKFISNIFKSAATLAIIVSLLIFIPIKIPASKGYEYDEAAQAYIQIKSTYPSLNWTIVSPVEQYQQVLGHGWHYDLTEFVKKIPAADQAGDASFTIPTDYVFIFTEKIPFGSNKTVEMIDQTLKIPETQGDATEFYYRNVANRAIVEAKAYYWAEEYMKRNKNMEVYFDGQYLKIFLIKQDAKKPARLFSHSNL